MPRNLKLRAAAERQEPAQISIFISVDMKKLVKLLLLLLMIP